MTSFAELLKHDPAFRAFVDAQRGHDAVALAALKVELEHRERVISDLRTQLLECHRSNGYEPRKGRKK